LIESWNLFSRNMHGMY